MFLVTTNGCLLFGLLVIHLCIDGCVRKPVSVSDAPVVYVGSPIQRDVSIYSEWIGTMVGFVDSGKHK